jgi:hypothetical protein
MARALAILGLLAGACAARADTPVVAKAGSPAQIERLIQQLGSDRFSEREAAAKALEAIGVPALEALRRAASRDADAERRQRAGELVRRIENGLDALLAAYREYGLPLPPPKARLVRYMSGGGAVIVRKVEPLTYSLAFEVRPATQAEGALLLDGVYLRRHDDHRHLEAVDPAPAAVKDLRFIGDSRLAKAIQCHARGCDELARYLLEKSQEGADSLPREQVVQMAWYYWCGHLTKPKIDRAPIAQRLRRLIRQDRRLDTRANRALLKSLELALAPSRAAPGSVEALIDALVDYDSNTSFGFYQQADSYWHIARLGFEAVPALIEHLDDERLTRAMMLPFNNFRSFHLRIGDVVSDLLEGLAGENIGRDWLRRQQGQRVTEAQARKWWESARKVGEEAYLLAHVLPAKGKQEAIREQILRVLRAKYPRHIPGLYRTILAKRPDLRSWTLADAVLASKIATGEKVDLFLEGTHHKDPWHRLPALSMLREVDTKRFNERLLATLEEMPTDIPGPYWYCPEAQIAGLAILSEDPRVWAAVDKIVHRSALGLRMEVLAQFGAGADKPSHRRERLRLLASFLDDATLRDADSDKRFEDGCAGEPYYTIEVRDFVALEIAGLMGTRVELNLERTPAEWAKIRAMVRQAMKKELGKAPSAAPSRVEGKQKGR